MCLEYVHQSVIGVGPKFSEYFDTDIWFFHNNLNSWRANHGSLIWPPGQDCENSEYPNEKTQRLSSWVIRMCNAWEMLNRI